MPQLTNLTKLLNANAYLRNSTINFIGSFLVNFLSYLFNLIIGRVLGPQSYGEFFSILSIWYIAVIPSGILQTTITKNIAYFNHRSNPQGVFKTFDILTRYSLLWGAAAGLVMALMIPFLSQVLKIDNLPAFILLVILVVLSYISATWLSYFSGKERFVAFALLSGLGLVVRMLCVGALMLFTVNAAGVLLTILVGLIVQLLAIAYIIFRERQQPSIPAIEKIRAKIAQLIRPIKVETEIKSEMLTTLKTSFASTLGLALITQSDIILARAKLSAHDAGLYTSLAVTGKVIPFLTLPLIGVLLPHITGKIAKNEPYKKTLILAATLVTAGSGAVAIFYTLFPQFVITIFLGKDYLESAPYLAQFSLFQMLYALATLGVAASIAMNNIKATLMIALTAIIQITLILILPPTISNIILSSTLSLSTAVIYYTYTLFLAVRR